MERELPSWLQPPKAEKPELAQDATRREYLRVQFEKAFSTSGESAPQIAQEAMKLVNQDGVKLEGRSKEDLRNIADTYAMKLYEMSQKPVQREAMVTPSTEALAEAQRMQQEREAKETPKESPEVRTARARDAFVEAMAKITNDAGEARMIYGRYVSDRNKELLADMAPEAVSSLAERYAERIPIALGEALDSMIQEEIPELPNANIEPGDQPQTNVETAA